MIREVWRIELGVGVGPFRLGASIAEVLLALKSRLPVRPFEVAYDATEPYKRDVVVDSAEDGLKLHFDPVRQILKVIEFYDVNRVALKFGRVVIFGGDISATFMSVYNLFGPTFPGHYDASEQTYVLGYEGGCVKFPIPAEYRNLYQNGTDLPMEFPEVISELGAPVSVFRKSEDPNDGATVAGGLVGDYFHNYPHLGLDILYDSMHRASKVILKTNALGHPDFGAYNKCNFRLSFQSSSALQKSGISKRTSQEITPQTPVHSIAM
ncbi:hypothetical protein AM587_10009696 [Phytophthora nicotianae]|uniref:Uncharacterized protein n=1 Tax=Phytophthora nicotianae TaxID=4792 RepID=A0A0W8CZA9_PHYNI|nr:hypothetical protein AM587_10009696 [Phytophthora nicotianae]